MPEGEGPFPAVVLVHGYGGGTHENKNIHMCNELAKEGFVALRFDFYDKPNGISEPSIENMSVTQQIDTTKSAIDFISSLEYVDKNKIGLTGHSLGGMTVVLYTPTDDRIKALVVQSAVSKWGDTNELKKYAQPEVKERGYLLRNKSWGEMKINYSFYEDGFKHDIFRSAEKIKCPTLVFHGDMDASVPIEHAKELIKHLKTEDRLEIIKGADHCYYDNDTLPIATKLMIEWFKKWL